jgi:hypothetical protein
MANEIFSPSSDRKGNIVGGVSSAEDGQQIVLRLDPTTKRLLVASDTTLLSDGDAVDAESAGTLVLGTDGTNYQAMKNDSDGRSITAQKAATGTLSNVSGSDSSVTVLAANTARLGATIWNDSTAILYIKLGATASATSCTVKLLADAYYEVPYGYHGIIDGIWSSATGAARVTEVT